MELNMESNLQTEDNLNNSETLQTSKVNSQETPEDTKNQSEEKNKENKKENTFSKPSFENIDPRNLQFKFSYRCAMSTVGQVVQGLSHTSRYLDGKDDYENNKKPVTNKFQEFLYPKISELSQLVVNTYLEKFILSVTDKLTKEVYGFNLNGYLNNGQLTNPVTCIGVSRNVRYEYIQFKNLISLLHYRLNFISKKDPLQVKRYKENEQERICFESLKLRAREFCEFIESTVFTKWEEIKTESKQFSQKAEKTESMESMKVNGNENKQEIEIENFVENTKKYKFDKFKKYKDDKKSHSKDEWKVVKQNKDTRKFIKSNREEPRKHTSEKNISKPSTKFGNAGINRTKK